MEQLLVPVPAAAAAVAAMQQMGLTGPPGQVVRAELQEAAQAARLPTPEAHREVVAAVAVVAAMALPGLAGKLTLLR